MRVSELKGALDSRGINYAGVIEKSELQKLVRESKPAADTKKRPTKGGSQPKEGARPRKERGGGRDGRASKESSFLRLASAAEKLNVALDASDEQLAAAHRHLMKQHHPDKNPEDREAAERRFKDAGAAYQLLNDVPRSKRAALLRHAKQQHAERVQRRKEEERQEQEQEHQSKQQRQSRPSSPPPQQQQQQQQQQQRPLTMASAGNEARAGGVLGGSPPPKHFHEILAARARERESNVNDNSRGGGDGGSNGPRQHSAPQPVSIDRHGDGGGGGEAANGPTPWPSVRQKGEEGLFGLCIDSCAAVVYVQRKCHLGLERCYDCVLDCGGLLSIDKELRSWGVSENPAEQPSVERYYQKEIDEERKARASARVAARRANEEAEAGSRPWANHVKRGHGKSAVGNQFV
jgi:hypothetical protein